MRASKLVSAAVFTVAVVSLSFGSAFAGPSQGVDRYQSGETTYLLALQVNSTTYYHEFVAAVDGCAGSTSVAGAYMGTDPAALSIKWEETVTNWAQTSDTLTFTARYETPGPTPYSYTYDGSSADGGLTYAGTLVAPNGSWDDVTVRVTDPTVCRWSVRARPADRIQSLTSGSSLLAGAPNQFLIGRVAVATAEPGV
jgi:hypothetical protein